MFSHILTLRYTGMLHLFTSVISAEVRLLSHLITRCAGSLISLTWPLSQVPVLTKGNLSQSPPPTLYISIHHNKQAVLLEINKEIKLALCSKAN